MLKTQSSDLSQTILVAVRFTLDPGWHIYWKNPGDAGAAPSLDWTLPPGFKVLRTFWPTPQRIVAGGIVSYGYEGAPTLLVQIETPKLARQSRHALYALNVGFLVCSDVCLPGTAKLDGDLANLQEGFDPVAVRKAMPTISPTDNFAFSVKDGTATLQFNLQNVDPADIKSAYFFAAESAVLDHAADQKWTVQGNALVLEARVSKFVAAKLKRPEGVLVLELSHKTVAIEYFVDKSQESKQ